MQEIILSLIKKTLKMRNALRVEGACHPKSATYYDWEACKVLIDIRDSERGVQNIQQYSM